MNRHSWTYEEDEAILKLVNSYGIEDWTKIASKLREEYTFIKRTGKQCRERWYNHLSPSVNKLPWSQREEAHLFQLHRHFGNRWKDISKEFEGRTDNDIKNHFYSTLRRSLRRLNKVLGEKNSTSQMREIKPSVLSSIMHSIYDHEPSKKELISCLRDFPKLVFQFANFKPIKNSHYHVEQERQSISEIFDLISKFNHDYQRGKKSKVQLTPKTINLHSANLEIKTSISLEDTNENQDKPPIPQSYDSEDEGQRIALGRQRTISLEEDQMMDMEFHDPEQPSFELVVVGRRLETKMWEVTSEPQFVDEVLAANYDNL